MNRIVVTALIAFLIGSAATWGYYEHKTKGGEWQPESGMDNFWSQSSLFDAFDSVWPTQPLMREWPSLPDSHLGQIEMIKGSDKTEFRLPLNDQTLDHLDVSSRNRQLVIVAELSSDAGDRISKSSIRQSLPIPAEADPATLRVEQTDSAVVIEFDHTG